MYDPSRMMSWALNAKEYAKCLIGWMLIQQVNFIP